MRQLWSRIRDYVVLATLLITSILVMINQNDPVVGALRALSLDLTARVESQFAWMGRYLGALEENDALRSTNIDLSSQVARLRQAELSNTRLRNLLALRDTSDFTTLAARIIYKDVTQQKNTLTLDVGSEDGVREGMAVIDERGILGKILLTSDHYSLVQSYLNTDFRVPVQVLPSQTFGIVRWEGNRQQHRLLLEYVVKTNPVYKNQLAVTSQSEVFPPGLPVGRIDSVMTQPGRNELRIYLEPASPISQAEYAFVILHTPDPELSALQERAQ